MASQSLPAAAKGFGTVKLSGAGPLADSSLAALLIAALSVTELDARITGCNLRIVAATTFYWENDGTAADANAMPLSVGDELIVPKNSREALHQIRILATGAYDFRVMLW